MKDIIKQLIAENPALFPATDKIKNGERRAPLPQVMRSHNIETFNLSSKVMHYCLPPDNAKIICETLNKKIGSCKPLPFILTKVNHLAVFNLGLIKKNYRQPDDKR